MKDNSKVYKWIIAVSITILVISVVIISIFAEKWFNGKVLLATIVSGSISAFSTVIIGFITLFQNKKFKDFADEIENSVDLTLELFEEENVGSPDFIRRKCEFDIKRENTKQIRLFLTNYYKNPVFDIKAKCLYLPDRTKLYYKCEEISKLDQYRTRGLRCGNSMHLIIDIPNDYLQQNYVVELEFKNHNNKSFYKNLFLTKQYFENRI